MTWSRTQESGKDHLKHQGILQIPDHGRYYYFRSIGTTRKPQLNACCLMY
ncbi:MAG: hypothetical protein IPJ39_22225 [Saprospiraceae bacterium]|nr:hypothetical protein [Saprospiraceae bacterium]